jgi:hypothetical protein
MFGFLDSLGGDDWRALRYNDRQVVQELAVEQRQGHQSLQSRLLSHVCHRCLLCCVLSRETFIYLSVATDSYEIFLGWSAIIPEKGCSTCFQIVMHKNIDSFDRRRFWGEGKKMFTIVSCVV